MGVRSSVPPARGVGATRAEGPRRVQTPRAAPLRGPLLRDRFSGGQQKRMGGGPPPEDSGPKRSRYDSGQDYNGYSSAPR